MKNTFLIVFSLLFILSCDTNDDCAATDPPQSTIQISIIDSEGNSLIGEENIYKPSEIRLDRDNQNIPMRFYDYDGKTFIEFNYYEMESEKDYNLKLNEQETDVLNLQLNTYNTDCFKKLRSVVNFILNGEEIVFDTESYAYIIQK